MTREELESKIKYLEDKINCCSCGKEEFYELEDLKEQLCELESED